MNLSVFSRTLLAFLAFSVFVSLFIPVNATTYNIQDGKYYYLTIVEGHLGNTAYGSFLVQATAVFDIRNSRIQHVYLQNISVYGMPHGLTDINNVIRSIYLQWLEDIKLVSNTTSSDITYVSVNGKIIKACICIEDNRIEYRDLNTGIYLGGESSFTTTIDLRIWRRTIDIPAYVIITSYLVRTKPTSIVEKFYVVEIPVEKVRLFGGIIAAMIVIGAVFTISRWDKYKIV